ncbi:hypothetical protein AB5J52_27770 [Streptomyces sp. R39]|uniref:Uncharacterized protein n=1 Tax=Streptomyces sp. R39 TaxID=3238631 RepID=A0AB39QU37_9ACTN
MTEGDTAALADRIADLDRQIEGMNASIAAVIVATAKQSKSADAIETATAVLNEELQQLQNLRDEAAEWLTEMEESDQRARDLIALAAMAKRSFPDMAPEQQAAILSMLELKVTITGPVPDDRRGGVPCTVRAWYAASGLGIPVADLSDEEWARSLSPTAQGPQGHRPPVLGRHLLQGAYRQIVAGSDQGHRRHNPGLEALQRLDIR